MAPVTHDGVMFPAGMLGSDDPCGGGGVSSSEESDVEIEELQHKAERAPRRSRRPSVRSVHGSQRVFTVVNYDQDAGPADPDYAPRSPSSLSEPVSSAGGVRFALEPSSGSRPSSPLLVEKPASTPTSPAIKLNNNNVFFNIQRSLSISDDQDFRKATRHHHAYDQVDIESGLKANDNGYHYHDHNHQQQHQQQEEEVYKSWTKKTKQILDIAKRGRLYANRKRERLVFKNGYYNLSNTNIEKKAQRYAEDFFTTLLEMKWKWSLLLFVLAFLLGWVLFALLWWLITHLRGAGSPCVSGVNSFVSALLFSVETQQTIGYGTRAVTEDCPEAVVLMMVQSLFGVVVQCVVTGIIFAKLGHARKRAETVMFSKHAVIHKHDRHLCLMFRIGDMRKAHMICVTLSAILVRQKNKNKGKSAALDAPESETADFKRYKLELHAESDDLYFMAWPITVVHRIDEASPLWDETPDRLLADDFEIIVVLEGVNEMTGATTQIRTSYLPGEIMWGHKLAPLVTYQRQDGKYNIDYSRFHEVRPVDTLELSAHQLTEHKQRRLSARSLPIHIPTHHPTGGGRGFTPREAVLSEHEEDEEEART